jgi:hypothetical protein
MPEQNFIDEWQEQVHGVVDRPAVLLLLVLVVLDQLEQIGSISLRRNFLMKSFLKEDNF